MKSHYDLNPDRPQTCDECGSDNIRVESRPQLLQVECFDCGDIDVSAPDPDEDLS